MRRVVGLSICLKHILATLLLLLIVAGTSSSAYAMTSAEESKASAQYEQALSLIVQQRYTDAVATLRVIQRDYPQFSKIASVQTRIAVLHEASSAGDALADYLQALDERESDQALAALDSLQKILDTYPNTSLRDDALYLKAYMQVMERFEFRKARQTLNQLNVEFEEGAYQDSSEYLDGIALEQLGETQSAIATFQSLRDRHTAASLPLDFNWPKDSVLSRYWFDRADKRLNMLDLQIANASVVRSADKTSNRGDLSVEVSVAGTQWQLLLWPGSMVRDTSWLDGSFSDAEPPKTAFYEGEVFGAENSWVRAVISNGEILGVFEVDGVEYQMEAGSLIGTLDYYQPLSEKQRSASTPDSTSEDALLTNDTRSVPDADVLMLQNRAQQSQSDIQVIPLSIVIDNEFDRYYGGQGLATVLNELNVADGIYRKFDLALTLDKVQVFTDEDVDPVIAGPSTLEGYLRSFRLYRLDQSEIFSDSVLSYLFTGKTKTDLNLGIAWIGSICRSDGYDVGVTTPSAIGGLLLTHEIAHSLGAVHDDVTSCSNETDKLMWPYLSTETKSVFSDCSRENLSGANSKTCLIDGIDISLSVSGSANEVTINVTNPDSQVSVSGTLVLESSTLDVLLLPEQCTKTVNGGGECTLKNIAPLESRSITIPLNYAMVNDNTIVSAEMASTDVFDFAKKNNVVEYQVLSGTQVQMGDDSVMVASNAADSTGGSGGSLMSSLIFLMAILVFRVLLNTCGYRRFSYTVPTI